MLCKALFIAAGGKAVEVQYNPSAVQLWADVSSAACGCPQISGMADCTAQSVDRGGMTLSMELIVDNTGRYETADMVQAFLGLMARERTKQVIFAWEEMTFYGSIQSLSAVYEMFDPDGTPVRGKIQISLSQCSADERVWRYWEQAYRRMLSPGK